MQPLRNARSWKCQFDLGATVNALGDGLGASLGDALAPATFGLSALAGLLPGLLQGQSGSPAPNTMLGTIHPALPMPGGESSLLPQTGTMANPNLSNTISTGIVQGGAGGNGGGGGFFGGGGGGGGGGGASESNSQANNSFYAGPNLAGWFQPPPFAQPPSSTPYSQLPNAQAAQIPRGPSFTPVPTNESAVDTFSRMSMGAGGGSGVPFLAGALPPANQPAAPPAMPMPQAPQQPLQGGVAQNQQAPAQFQGNVPPLNAQAPQTPLQNPGQMLAQVPSLFPELANATGPENNLAGEEGAAAPPAQALEDLEDETGGGETPTPPTDEYAPQTSAQLFNEAMKEHNVHSKEGYSVATAGKNRYDRRMQKIRNAMDPPIEAAALAYGKSSNNVANPPSTTDMPADEQAWRELDRSKRNLLRNYFDDVGPDHDPLANENIGQPPTLKGGTQAQRSPGKGLLRTIGRAASAFSQGYQANQFYPNNAPLIEQRLRDAAEAARAAAVEKQQRQDAENTRTAYQARIGAITQSNLHEKHANHRDAGTTANVLKGSYDELRAARKNMADAAYQEEKFHMAADFKALDEANKATNEVISTAKGKQTGENEKVTQALSAKNTALHAQSVALAAKKDARDAAAQPQIAANRELDRQLKLKSLNKGKALLDALGGTSTTAAPELPTPQLAAIKARAAKDPAFAAKARAKGYKV